MKRLLSLLLCLALAFSLMPAAFAEADEGDNASDGTQLIDKTIIVEPASENEEGEPAAPDEPTDAPEDAVQAVEPTDEDELEAQLLTSVTWTNPTYASIDFSAIETETQNVNPRMFLRGATLEATVYSDVSTAAAYVRNQMKNRVLNISLSYDANSLSGSSVNSKMMEIFKKANEHTGVPTEGDSILYCYPGMGGYPEVNSGTYTFHYYITTLEKFNEWMDPFVNEDGYIIRKPTGEPTYVGYYTSAAQENELTAKINAILVELNMTGKSDFEKVRAIYAYICDHVSYDRSHDETYKLQYTAYAAAINGTAVCQGIATLFYRLALEYGIDTRVIDGETGNHAWNIVKLNDKYYYLDATWDETRTQSTWVWFLRGSTFVLADRDHTPDGEHSSIFLPSYTISTTDYIGSKTLTLDFSGFDLGRTDGAIYIDGVPYIPTASTITLPDVTSKTAVLYYFNNTAATDRHTVYPQNMYVWTLKYQDGAYTATRMSDFDNILQYAGSSMRLTGTKGVRMISSVPKNMKSALTSAAGFNGYTLLEYGTRAAWSNTLGSAPLVNGGANVFGNHAYKKSTGEDPIFKTTDSVIQFTNALTFTDIAKCAPDLALRPYMILQDPNGVYITLYGGIIYRNIGYMAYQNRATFTAGTEAYNYIWSIINYVYPNGYTAA